MLKEIFLNDLSLGSDKWAPYFEVYETYFHRFVGRAPVVMEVGVQSGGSLQLWRKYFGPQAKIWGIDVDPEVAKLLPLYDENTNIIIGDQANPLFWDSVFNKIPTVDIFIDDGGHYSYQQRKTFECVFPKLAPGGVFVCEDTHSSYMPWLDGGRDRKDTFIEYAKRYVDHLHSAFFEQTFAEDFEIKQLAEAVKSVHFYNSMVVFQKKQVVEEEFKRILVNK
jgi:hypothetical protein